MVNYYNGKTNEIAFNTVIEDIRHAKNQQWLITYYVVLLLAGTTGLYNLLSNANIQVAKYFIPLSKFAIISIPFIGNLILLQYQVKIIRYRYFKNSALNEENRSLFEITDIGSWECCFVDLFVNNFCFVFVIIYYGATFAVSIYLFKELNFLFLIILALFLLFTNLVFGLCFACCKKNQGYKKIVTNHNKV